MKETDLRLGNIIEKQFLPDGHWDWGYYNKTDNLSQFPQCYRPVALSHEWLIRLGALKEISKEGWRYAIGHMDYSYVLEPRNDFGFTDGGYFMGIRYDDWDADPITINRFAYLKNGLQYVHQLQNIFQTLTGEELTLKP